MKRKEISRDNKFGLPQFESEILLQQAIAGLLSRMPDITGVQILQGAQEYGKDIIFYTSGPLEESFPCACVIKNVKISGAVGQDKGARTVFQQVEQALDIPFSSGSGEKVRVHRAYVISPAEITQIAMNSIIDKLEKRSGQVIFIGGHELFQLFRKHWPEFLADEYNVIQKYLNDISEISNQNLASLTNLYSLGELDKADTVIYVERFLRRELPVYTLKSIVNLMWGDFFKNKPDQKLGKEKKSGKGKVIEFGKETILRIRENLDLFQKSLRHLYEWGYVDPIVYGAENKIFKSFDYLNQAVASLRDRLVESWTASAKKKLKQKSVSIELLPSQFMVAIPEFEFESLEKSASLLLQSIDESLLPLREACRVTQAVSEVKSYDVGILSNSDWLASSRLDNCLEFAPQDICDATPGLTITFDEAQLRNHHGAVLILGAAGYGKTSLCRWNALVDAEHLHSNTDRGFPVYVPLHSLSTAKLETFEKAFLKGLGHSALLQNIPFNESYNIRLYLDGLDEVPSETQQKDIIELIGQGWKDAKDLQVIITARDYVRGSWLGWLPQLYLSGLSETQINKLQLAWFKGESTLITEFRSQLTKSAGFSDLMAVPLLATLIIHVFRQTTRLPDNKIRLYNVFLDLLCDGWDFAKRILRRSAVERHSKTAILAELAASVHFEETKLFKATAISSAFRNILSGRNDISVDVVEKELLRDGVISKSGEQYFFSHLSFQEFLTAKHLIGNPMPKGIGQVLTKLLKGEQWWSEVFRFYIGLSENPSEVTKWLLSELNRRPVQEHRAKIILSMVKETYPDFDLASCVKTHSKRKW